MFEAARIVRELTSLGFEARPYRAGVEVRLPGCWQRLTVDQAQEFIANFRWLNA